MLCALVPLLLAQVPVVSPPLPLKPVVRPAAAAPGNAVIRATAGPSDIVVTTTARLAGAIHSLTWNGREFIDSVDHGRQLQSACSFGGPDPNVFWAEAYNPTEAGSRRDGAGPTSTSQLLEITGLAPNRLRTRTRMAYWLAPGEFSDRYLALNKKLVSDVELLKDVTIGLPDYPHALEHRITFRVGPTERHAFAQFEALTGYMPPGFSTFQTLDPATGKVAAISYGPGEQPKPLIFSTPDGLWAMGAWCPTPGAGYGRWNFLGQNVVKWNVVYRKRNPAGVPPGDYSYRVYVAVGSVANVQQTLFGLMHDPRHNRP
jgi:hypothetical protein